MSQFGIGNGRSWCLAIAVVRIFAAEKVRLEARDGSRCFLGDLRTGRLDDPCRLMTTARRAPPSDRRSTVPCDPRPAFPARDVLADCRWIPRSDTRGQSGVMPTEEQESSHFVPIEDRWRIGYPDWDRYGKGHPILDDYPYLSGRWFDVFNQNVFKGDYPILGQHTFLEVTSQANLDFEGRQVPTQTSGFESTEHPFSGNFFGRPSSFITLDFFSFSLDLFHGTGAFKPVDWRIKLTPTLGVSNFSFSEVAQTSPNVLQGTTRTRKFWALQEAFFEYKLADLGPDYDFVSVRAGTQPFNADFRGFLFADINRAVRIFGTQLLEPRPVQPGVFSPVGKRHQYRAQHVQ